MMTYLDLACMQHIMKSFQQLTKRQQYPDNMVASADRQELAADIPDYAAADETGAVPLGLRN